VSANYSRVADFARDLGETIAHEMKRQLGLPEARAIEIGVGCAQRICDEYRGELIYVPIGSTRIDKRDRELIEYHRSHGKDVVATAKQFDLCVQTVYRRIKIIETAELNERQGGLFEDTE
jgi:Mor family transcriptional regulator